MDAERGEGHGFPPWDPEGELAIADDIRARITAWRNGDWRPDGSDDDDSKDDADDDDEVDALAADNYEPSDEDDPEYVIVLPRCRTCQRAWPVPGFCTTCIEQGAGPEQHWTAPLEAAMMHRLAATPMPAVAVRASEPDDDSEAAPRDERYDRWAAALASDDSSSDEDDSSTGLSFESGAETPVACVWRVC
eukprot:SAG11_NODE_3000_length_2776_cov_13.243183_2_plen_191_part_00